MTTANAEDTSDVDTESLDGIISKNVLSHLRRDPPKAARAVDDDLFGSMAARLASLEQLYKDSEAARQRQDAENFMLKAKLGDANHGGSDAAAAAADDLAAENRRLRQQCKLAWQQVAEIKAFLNDYGMVWVGTRTPTGTSGGCSRQDSMTVPAESSNAQQQAPQVGNAEDAAATAASSPPQHTQHTPPSARPAAERRAQQDAAAASPVPPFDVEELRSRVEALNQVAGDGCATLVAAAPGRISKLHTPEPVKLVLYRDALQLHAMPARPYSDATATAIVRDILDGYFPFVLKKEFPNGTPLQVVDRSQELAVAATADIAQFQVLNGHSSSPFLTGDRLLGRLPQSVIKNGKVVSVRSEVEKYVQGEAPAAHSAVAVINTPASPSGNNSSGAAPTGEVTTLQVKREDGKQTYILKLSYDDTIADVRAFLNEFRGHQQQQKDGGGNSCSFEIRSAFPARAYTDPTETLRAAGLVPTATLFLRACSL